VLCQKRDTDRTAGFGAGKPPLSAALLLLLYCPLLLLRVGGQTPDSNVTRARDTLREGIESKEPNTRIQAIIAASMIGSHELVLKRLEAALQDKDVPVRIAAVQALSDLKAPQIAPALEKTLRQDEVPEVTFAAAKALYKLQDPAGSKALREVYDAKINTNSNYLKKQSRNAFRNFHSVQSAAMFVVSQGVGFVPLPGVGEGFSAMMDLLNDPNLSARASVVLLLGKEKNAPAVDLLQRALTDSDWSVRAAGAQMIAQTGRLELRDSLLPLFADKKEKVRFRAAGAYLHLFVQQRK
jgi:HEAT repeat protein